MIISHKHQFIFLHCRKTAGSSITCYLNRFLGPLDLQVGAWEDTIGSGGSYNMRLFMDLSAPTAVADLLKHIVREVLAEGLCRQKRCLSRALNRSHKNVYRTHFGENPGHATAERIRAFLGHEWNEYFKFCFVRNPYDKALSDYNWRTKEVSDISFVEFLQRVADPSADDPEGVVPVPRTNWDIYTIDGEVAVDYIGRFERLEEDLRIVCQEVGLPFDPSELPQTKVSTGCSNGYREAYDAKTRDLVAQIYEVELEHFGYEY